MEDPPGSPSALSGSTEPSGRASRLPHGPALPPRPTQQVAPPPRHSIARRRPSGSHSKRAVISFGSLPYQLRPRMPRLLDARKSQDSGGDLSTSKAVKDDSAERVLSDEFSRFKMLSVDDVPPIPDPFECDEPGTTKTDISRLNVWSPDDLPHTPDSSDGHDDNKCSEESFGKGDSVTCPHSSNEDSAEDGDCPFGNPFLRDSYGNLTKWRLSDLSAAFDEYLEDQANNPEPKGKKYTKEEKLKFHSDRMERYMKLALRHYNSAEKLVGDMTFEFEEVQNQNWIVEGEHVNQSYYHFNFAAKQARSSLFTFFAEVTPEDGDDCDVTCCKLLNDDDNGHCFGCKNQGVDDLRHPAYECVYVGGHEDRKFPFMEGSETEDDSD